MILKKYLAASLVIAVIVCSAFFLPQLFQKTFFSGQYAGFSEIKIAKELKTDVEIGKNNYIFWYQPNNRDIYGTAVSGSVSVQKISSNYSQTPPERTYALTLDDFHTYDDREMEFAIREIKPDYCIVMVNQIIMPTPPDKYAGFDEVKVISEGVTEVENGVTSCFFEYHPNSKMPGVGSTGYLTAKLSSGGLTNNYYLTIGELWECGDLKFSIKKITGEFCLLFVRYSPSCPDESDGYTEVRISKTATQTEKFGEHTYFFEYSPPPGTISGSWIPGSTPNFQKDPGLLSIYRDDISPRQKSYFTTAMAYEQNNRFYEIDFVMIERTDDYCILMIKYIYE